MLIVFTEMILTTFLDFHLMSNPHFEAILQLQMFVPHLKHPASSLNWGWGHEMEANQYAMRKLLG